MKHEIQHLRPIYQGAQYCGSIRPTGRGFICYDARGREFGACRSAVCSEDPAEEALVPRGLAGASEIGPLSGTLGTWSGASRWRTDGVRQRAGCSKSNPGTQGGLPANPWLTMLRLPVQDCTKNVMVLAPEKAVSTTAVISWKLVAVRWMWK
jgi:hypothetical protein